MARERFPDDRDAELAALRTMLAELHEAAADIVCNRIEYGPAAAPRVRRLTEACAAAGRLLKGDERR